MAVGEIITRTRFNLMQNRIAEVLGQGQGTFGYGQTLSSSPVSLTNDVSAAHLNLLKVDLNKVKVHQTGTTVSLPSLVVNTDVNDADWVLYETELTTLYNNKQGVYASQTSTEFNKLSVVRTSSWGTELNTVMHTVTVLFPGNYVVGNTNGTTSTATGEDHRRHFFNSGGEIRFSASLTGVSGDKAGYWRDLLAAMQTIKFNYTETVSSALVGTPSSIGNNDLTGTFQTIYSHKSSGIYAGIYAGINAEYTVRARAVSTSKLEFQIIFTDSDTGSLDEAIIGTLTSSVSQLRATGSYVEVVTPVYTSTALG